MRHIDNRRLQDQVSKAWKERARKALEKVRAAADADARREALDKGAAVWADVRTFLEDLSQRHCWYCEGSEIRSDMPVDHFRPKSAVKEDATHPGYWWLAFDLMNFRLSCTFCNSWRIDRRHESKGGKHEHFPLLEGSPRVRSETESIGAEKPILLDPCDPKDPPLLTFRQDGMPMPRKSRDKDAIGYLRAERSIHWYHLDHHFIVEHRKDVWKRVDDLVNRGVQCLTRGDSLEHVKEDLQQLLQRKSGHSRVAHIALRGRRDVPWVEEWLDEIETTLS